MIKRAKFVVYLVERSEPDGLACAGSERGWGLGSGYWLLQEKANG